jgi:uncharacterized protein (TIGR03435 family)
MGMQVRARVWLGTIALGLIHAQAPAPRPHFEVASIKPNTSCGNRRGGEAPPSPGRLNLECATVQSLIQAAYGFFADGIKLGIKAPDVSGGPSWAQGDFYDIAARAESGTPVVQMMGPMLQTLLEERFQLKLHRETKEVPVYFLTVAKSGSRLEPTKEGACAPLDLDHLTAPTPGQPPRFCGNTSMSGRAGTMMMTMTAQGITMERLANGMLTRFAGRPIIDKTGLSGMYDLQIEFARDSSMPGGGRGPAGDAGTSGPPVASTIEATGPTIFEALQKLGLKLESGKGPTDVLVIDHLERPSEN